MDCCSNTGKGAIFDLDGTLLDSMGVWDQVDIDFLAKRGIAVPPDYMTKVASMQFRQIAEYTIARFGLKDTPEELMEEWDAMARVMYATCVEAKPGAADYLRRLRASGAKLAVATSLPPQLREPAMAHVGILEDFDAVVSVDDANDVGKDRPDVYLLAARRLGVAPADCTVFEDLLVGMRSAKSVGMRVWAMHDDSSAADWPAICELADGVLFDFADAPLRL
ncbi:HAD family phosphatase [Bifidobacterium pullorum subsp. saeculare]|uniref:HAD family phosphatase n=1 Tax=Bifidobacterium pullorum subsp. saeculare TaxID=78257 RepID=A0A939B946_9BIFI|nr:HAD family phosphatase [Bifidobacterium pullorum]MBM6699094.1 HAD family phosphatase [Bifidobacterium pullorum subsp. saeculare]